ncbi:MAG: hypothetical protein Q9183_006359 [Haloplaca sp. 2 TL-2023]
MALEKARAYHALMKDAVQEIEDWDPDEDDDFFGEADSDSNDEEKVNGASSLTGADIIQDGIAAPNRQSDNDPPALDTLHIQDIHALRDHALEFSKHIRMVYPALIKGRISPFPQFNNKSVVSSLPSSSNIQTLNQMLQYVQQISTEMDHLACALYEQRAAEVYKYQKSMTALAQQCVGYLKTDWGGNKGQYGDWAAAWTKKMEAINAKV